MSSFVASPIRPVSDPNLMLECGPFWPDVDINHFRDAMRVGANMVPDARILNCLLDAVIQIDTELANWRAAQEATGMMTLGDVPSPQIGSKSRLILCWMRAVYAAAAAALIETHRDITVTDAGSGRAALGGETADDHRRNAIHAVRDILGTNRNSAELI